MAILSHCGIVKSAAIAALLLWAVPASAAPYPFQITRSDGAASLQAAPPGGDALASFEIDEAFVGAGSDEDALDIDTAGEAVLNRTIAPESPAGPTVRTRLKAKSNPELLNSVIGLNFHDQRFANGGNQFSVEPPDQGLCAGNGFVLESTNDVLRVYDADDIALTNVVDLNTFLGYPAAVNRTAVPVTFGPSVTDPSCYYDADTQRWFHVVLTLDRAVPTSQTLAGTNHLDISVSTSPDPRGSWVVYRIPVQNNGTQGTPNHQCAGGFCLGDYPHIGADANGFYITTNEFNLFAAGFHGSQIYAFSKAQLAANATTVNGVLFNTADSNLLLEGTPGFTVWPAQSPGAVYNLDNGGTEYLLSSQAVFSNTGLENRLRVWTITNTASLASASPAPVLTTRVANTQAYGVPPRSSQKPGNIPLANCLADTTIQPNCFQLVGAAFRFNNPETKLPSNDSRMQQVSYANGKLWGALDTGIVFSDSTTIFAGIAYFALNPDNAKVAQQGYVALQNNNVTYPALAVTDDGRGAIAFTVLGADHYPSAGYTSLDAKLGAGDIHIIAEGAGPDDGFSGYRPLGGNPTPRPRWGDYGAAAADGVNIWIASESIEQTCTYADYLVNTAQSPFGTCTGSRGALGNWATRISKLQVTPL